ncbi:NAD-dependent epimerase/dehydratase family protein [Neobacillus ginsengisoli]|uniref:Nucleoside-diphosphate-sugar epimerase n=1 Tax=Neobacillus ginsengisoli TaxID=904295 RepID=A0ABT9Y0R3_9BACI|nr:NAD-dependent epimerase/dehydratase family protein [Neobacillus ginsengisoli]MDQ0200742.1 nucleoside-diphosphate-sugar epimerase [Neobacillus ginsengisoli]
MEYIECPNDGVLQEDLNYIANSNIPLEQLKDRTILVTGATGLIGSQIIKALLCCNRLKKTNIKIIALARSKKKVQEMFGGLLNKEKLTFYFADIVEPITNDSPIINESIDYIIHGASITNSKFFIEHPVETINISLKGTANILELAKDKKVKSMVYLSSMEAFGVTDSNLEYVKEEDLGYIDILNVRSCYSEGKRMSECLCASYASEYDVPVKIARLAQTFGAGISYTEDRVFAQFAKSVINKTDIVLHTEGKSFGNYCYTRDTVIALLILLVKGNQGEAYTVSNEESNTTIRNMAQMVAEEIADGKIKVVFDIPKEKKTLGYAPDVKMHLSSMKMQALGWKPEIGLKEAYFRMIRSMENTKLELTNEDKN